MTSAEQERLCEVVEQLARENAAIGRAIAEALELLRCMAEEPTS